MLRYFLVLTGVCFALHLPDAVAVCWASGSELSTQQMVKVFDFEERQLGNHEKMPMNWLRIKRYGFPGYTHMGFDTKRYRTAKTSFKLQLNGGSAGVVLEPGVIPVVPGADYLITARVLTEKIKYSRVMLIGHFVDKRKAPILASTSHSDLVESNGRWSTVQFQISGEHPQAAWLVLQLTLIQPAEFPESNRNTKLGKHELLYNDIKAAVWFDDVTVYQLPRVDLTTQSPTNVIAQPDQPKLQMKVRDLTGRTLETTVEVFNETGQLIDTVRWPASQAVKPLTVWTPKLPQYGWYWARLRVRSEGRLLGNRNVAFIWLPDPKTNPSITPNRFDINAELVSDAERLMLPEIIKAIHPNATTLSIWHEGMSQRDMNLSQFGSDPLIADLLNRDVDVTLSFSEVPRWQAVASDTDINTPLDYFSRPSKNQAKILEALLLRYGRRVQRWQIGRYDNDEAFYRDDLTAVNQKLNRQFRHYIADPQLMLTWSALQDVGPDVALTRAIAIRLPVSIQPKYIQQYAKNWPVDSKEITVSIATLDPLVFGHIQRTEDLILRMVRTWQVGVDRLSIVRPWLAMTGRQPSMVPGPLLAVFSNTAARLDGRKVVGQLELGDGVQCLILDGANGGALVAWNESALPGQAKLSMYMGKKPVVVDHWGNRQALKEAEGVHTVSLTTMPIFIENVDVKLARFRGSFKITPDFIESSYKTHKHTFKLTNPYPRTITGTMRIVKPMSWNISPRTFNFMIEPGQTSTFPVAVIFPISELAGEKKITAVAEFDADRHHRVELSTPLKIGLESIVYSATLSIDQNKTGGKDVIVTAMINNVGDKPQSLYAFVLAKDQPRMERIISLLKPGQTVVKRFRFVDAADDLSGMTIRVGLRQIDGPAVLNQKLQVP